MLAEPEQEGQEQIRAEDFHRCQQEGHFLFRREGAFLFFTGPEQEQCEEVAQMRYPQCGYDLALNTDDGVAKCLLCRTPGDELALSCLRLSQLSTTFSARMMQHHTHNVPMKLSLPIGVFFISNGIA